MSTLPYEIHSTHDVHVHQMWTKGEEDEIQNQTIWGVFGDVIRTFKSAVSTSARCGFLHGMQ